MTERKHDLVGTHAYGIWRSIKKRCFLESHVAYADYGGRGITVHERWVSDVQAFVNYIKRLPGCPDELLRACNGKRMKITLDRKNNERGYVPGNLRWATAGQQAHNRRSNTLVKQGVTREACEAAGLPITAVRQRVRNGWSVREALSTPLFAKGGHR